MLEELPQVSSSVLTYYNYTIIKLIITLAARVVRDASAGKQYWAIYSELTNSYIGQIFDYGAKQSYNIIK